MYVLMQKYTFCFPFCNNWFLHVIIIIIEKI